jgi:hypothetical protein
LFKTEEWRLSYSRLCHADAVAGFFTFAGAAGVDRHIAVILVGNMPREKFTA